MLQSHGFAYAVEADRFTGHPSAGVDCTLRAALPVETVVGDLEPFAFAEEEDCVTRRRIPAAYCVEGDFALLTWMTAERPAVYGIVDEVDADRFAH